MSGKANPFERLDAQLTSANPVLGEEWLEDYWHAYVLPLPKGRLLPVATFELGQLQAVVLTHLQAKDAAWGTVANRVILPSGVMVHWPPERRKMLAGMITRIGGYIRGATEVSLGNEDGGWTKPLLITQAPTGLTVPIAITPSADGIVIRSLITPVSPYRLKALRERQ